MAGFDLHKLFDLDDHIDAIARHLPIGRLTESVFITGTRFRRYFTAFGKATQLYVGKLNEIACEHGLKDTTAFITDWERALGINQSCGGVQGDIETRRARLCTRLALENATTLGEYNALLEALGFEAEITPAWDLYAFPMTFPIRFFETAQHVRYTLRIRSRTEFTNLPFPLTFPIPFGVSQNEFLECILRQVAPCYVHLIFDYYSD